MSTRILIIEDNPANMSLMRYLLEAFGYEVLCADDGESGLERIRDESPDAVICDIQLPGIDGTEVAQICKADPELCEIPLIAVSALAMVGDRDRIMAAGFDGYMSKPIQADTFVNRVESYLRGGLRSGMKSVPGSASSSGASDPVPVRSSAGTQATVLIVDDTPTNLYLLREVLEPFGMTVVAAESGRSAIELLADFTPDLILADLHLGEEPDFEFLDRVKADRRLNRIPFLLLSSTTNKQSLVTTGRSKGAERFLFRPIAPEALVTEIRSCLEARE